MPPGRRKKACELCFKKKIKCDAREPECSNCILYKIPCRQSTARSQASPSVSRSRDKSSRSSGFKRIAELSPLEPALGVTEDLRSRDQAPSESRGSVSDEVSTQLDYGLWKFDPIHPTLYYGPHDDHLHLPELDDIMPLVDHYFDAVNPSIPLFNHASFMKIMTTWYRSSTEHDTISWAAILMVMCLGLQSIPSGSPLFSKRSYWINYSLRNTQALIPELISRDKDLLGLQVIVALALSFRHAHDLRPASIILGMAVRSAHRMQLQSTDPMKYFLVEDVKQRSNVFWVIYLLDKDLCLRLKIPPLLSDSDIDIPMPQITSDIDVALLGANSFSVFPQRLELARVEERVYNLLYSSHSLRVDASERRRRVILLQEMLDQWYACLPAVFKPDQALATMDQPELLQLTELHHASLLCALCIHGVWSRHAEWMQCLNSLSKAAVCDIAEALQGPKVNACTETQLPPLQSGWNYCVDASRWCMRLLQSLEPTDTLVWHNLCPHFSGIIVLLSNVLLQPAQSLQVEDLRLAAASKEVYIHLVQNSPSLILDSMKQIIKDLHNQAGAVSAYAQFGQNTISDLNLLANPADGQLFDFANDLLEQDPELLGLENYEDMLSL